jgi:hypothetical protein
MTCSDLSTPVACVLLQIGRLYAALSQPGHGVDPCRVHLNCLRDKELVNEGISIITIIVVVVVVIIIILVCHRRLCGPALKLLLPWQVKRGSYLVRFSSSTPATLTVDCQTVNGGGSGEVRYMHLPVALLEDDTPVFRVDDNEGETTMVDEDWTEP